MNERDAQRLERIHEKMEYMKAQRKDILARENKRKRNERTRRLIQIGALSERYFDYKDVQPVEYEKFLNALVGLSGAKEHMEHLKNSLQSD